MFSNPYMEDSAFKITFKLGILDLSMYGPPEYAEEAAGRGLLGRSRIDATYTVMLSFRQRRCRLDYNLLKDNYHIILILPYPYPYNYNHNPDPNPSV